MHSLVLQVALGCFTFSTAAMTDTKRGQNGHRRSPNNETLQKDINFGSLPKCAQPYCNFTAALSPSRLGCIDHTLTKECFCKEAVTPLDCVPSGPSSEDNCWYDVEDWFAGQCDEAVPLIAYSSMPVCLQGCVINWLHGEGCHSDTRNCFCKLYGPAIVMTADKCKKAGCAKHMQPKFDSAYWRDQICSQGEIEDYDEAAYRTRRKMVKDVQLMIPIFLGIVIVCLLGIGICNCGLEGGIFCSFAAIALVLLIIPPIFVAI